MLNGVRVVVSHTERSAADTCVAWCIWRHTEEDDATSG